MSDKELISKIRELYNLIVGGGGIIVEIKDYLKREVFDIFDFDICRSIEKRLWNGDKIVYLRLISFYGDESILIRFLKKARRLAGSPIIAELPGNPLEIPYIDDDQLRELANRNNIYCEYHPLYNKYIIVVP